MDKPLKDFKAGRYFGWYSCYVEDNEPRNFTKREYEYGMKYATYNVSFGIENVIVKDRHRYVFSLTIILYHFTYSVHRLIITRIDACILRLVFHIYINYYDT